MTSALVRRNGLTLDALARQAGLHPDLVRRFVALGLVDMTPARDGEARFQQRDVARVSRAQRLRTGLGLNYAALGLVLDLLDRVAALEAALSSPVRPHRGVTT
ncbi:MAG: hypothetical protein JWM02_3061 [Frankiales bacterium]|nr:hypothetical protein [Frankiales bacterium]